MLMRWQTARKRNRNMSYDWGKTEHNMTEPNAWQAVGGTIWTSEDNRPLPQWQGLTTDELKEIKDRFRLTGLNIAVAFRTIEAKLKEKNT